MYMSYRIEYDTRIGKYEVKAEKNSFLPVIVIIGMLILAVYITRGEGELRSFLIPGEDAVTAAAFHTMADDLRSGAGLWSAFTDFCRVVIRGA